jgi:hypothetical protein
MRPIALQNVCLNEGERGFSAEMPSSTFADQLKIFALSSFCLFSTPF